MSTTINTINVGGVDKGLEDTYARNNITHEASRLDARIDQIVAPSGEAPNPAEITDARIGVNNVTYPNLGTAIRTQVGNLNQALDYISNFVVAPELIVQGVWEDGIKKNTSTRICYPVRFFVRTGDVLYCKPGGLYLAINVYASKTETIPIENMEWTGGNSEFKYQFLHDGYVCLNIANTASYVTSTKITPSDYTMEISVVMQNPLLTELVKSEVLNGYQTYNGLVFFNDWTNKIYFFGEGIRYDSVNRIGLGSMFSPIGNLKVWCDSGYALYAGEFSKPVESVENELGGTGWVTTALLEQNHYYLINFKKTNEESISPTSNGINEHIHFCYTEITDEDIENPIKALFKPEGIRANYNLLLGESLINGLYYDETGKYDSTRTDYIAYPSELNLVGLIGNFVFLYTGNTTLTVHFIFLDKKHVRISNENKECTAKKPINVSIPNNSKYVLICATYNYTDINPTNYSFSVYKEYNTETTDEVLNGYQTYNGLVFFNDWTNKIYFFGEGIRYDSVNRIGLGSMFSPIGNLKVWCDSGYALYAGEFSKPVESVENELGGTGWVTTALLEQNHYYLINFKKTNEESISPTSNGINEHIHFCYTEKDLLNENCAVTACCAKSNVYLKDIGRIEGYQSFCKYNNKYYCSDGTNIYVYSNNFVLEQTVPLSVGHANSMQLGNYHSNYAYISGWNDDTVYIVNLDDLNIVGTISMPVSGYTTCAVDDVNEIVYIFYTTAFNTVTYYNFIAYDYANNQILRNKKITRKFGAMQSCDFVDGVIFALNGIGTSALPNGYIIYNTNGDIIGEYILESFASNEPEGVFVDRKTKEVYMLFIDKHVYKVQ